MPETDLFLFVSHIAEDRSTAMEIVRELEQRGIKCWIAPRDVRPGHPFDDEIVNAIENSRAMLLVFSDLCNESEYIRREVTVAGESHKIIIPFRIEDALPRHGLRVRLSDLHWIDGFAARERAIDELAGYLGKPSPTPSQREVPDRRLAGVKRHGPLPAPTRSHFNSILIGLCLTFVVIAVSVTLLLRGAFRSPTFQEAVTTGVQLAPQPKPAPPTQPPPPKIDPEVVFWQTIETSNNTADFEEYLRKYPAGQFGDLARNRIAALKSTGTASASNVAAHLPSLSGTWSVTYPGGPLRVRVHQNGQSVTVTLIDGNSWVPAGKLDLWGEYTSTVWNAKQICAGPGYTNPYFVDVILTVIDSDHLSQVLAPNQVCGGSVVTWERVSRD
jgi:hypothetical protein